jgi:hypothetical protein
MRLVGFLLTLLGGFIGWEVVVKGQDPFSHLQQIKQLGQPTLPASSQPDFRAPGPTTGPNAGIPLGVLRTANGP